MVDERIDERAPERLASTMRFSLGGVSLAFPVFAGEIEPLAVIVDDAKVRHQGSSHALRQAYRKPKSNATPSQQR
jgi:hypothetical protein